MSMVSHSYMFHPIEIDIQEQSKWEQQAVTVAGGHRRGSELNQLSYPQGIFVNQEKTIYIADSSNHRLVQWKWNENEGQIIAGGNGHTRLSHPVDFIIGKQNNSLVIADQGNRRVIRWSDQTNQRILISNIDCCWGVAMDKHRSLYACNFGRHEVRRWNKEDIYGTVVAGGNGRGEQLNQLSYPTFIFVDENESIYVSDSDNHRVMKWRKNAEEGMIVAGGHGKGKGFEQLANPRAIIVDHWNQIYVVDGGNHRVMRWREGSAEGEVVVGDHEGEEQLYCPTGLAFDMDGNLYVADGANHRIQMFARCI